MQKRFIRLIALFVLAVSVSAGAATRFITDEIRVNLRSGPGNQYRILELLTTGTTLETLQETEGWTQVRMGDGTSGWVPSQYLAERRPARERLAEARAELEAAREQITTLESTLEAVRAELSAAQSRAETLAAENETLGRRVERASEGLALANENQDLKKTVVDLQRTIQDLESETTRLADRSRHDWFLVGAGVLFAGMLFGIIVTRIRWRRRSSSWGQL